jgi:signal transduction histidine kinase
MSTPIRVLQVEDREEDALLVERELKRAGFEPTCCRVEYEDEMTRLLKKEHWDAIIADYTMPRFSGLQAFRVYRESGLDIPFIIVSGSIGEDLAVEAMKAGIHDYVMKNSLARLAPAIRREMRDAAEREARRQAENRLREVERMRTIGELTASLIHDLKNPLQSILGSSELLNSDDVSSESRQKFCSIIGRQVERMLSMSQEVLEFAKGETKLRLTPTDAAKLLREVVETYADPFAKAGIRLHCVCDHAAPHATTIVCDEQKVWRALLNLIGNAKDAMLDGGLIELTIRSSSMNVVLEVKDTGPGIPDAIRARLFEPFVTHGKPHGTGLGLAIVKNIAEAHGGSITCQSASGKGTTFSLTLPLHPPQPPDAGTRSAALTQGERMPLHG